MKVVPLRKPMGCENIPDTLRLIADEIENGSYADWPVTAAVLICTHEDVRPEGGDTAINAHWTTHGLGPRANSVFGIRGILASVMAWGMNGGDE